MFDSIFSFMVNVPVIRAVLGFFLMFFVPGFAWTFVFFKRTTFLVRILLSFSLSIAMVTLSLLFADWILNIKITGTNSVLIILVITVLPIGIYFLIRSVRRMMGKTDEAEEEDEEEPEPA